MEQSRDGETQTGCKGEIPNFFNVYKGIALTRCKQDAEAARQAEADAAAQAVRQKEAELIAAQEELRHQKDAALDAALESRIASLELRNNHLESEKAALLQRLNYAEAQIVGHTPSNTKTGTDAVFLAEVGLGSQ